MARSARTETSGIYKQYATAADTDLTTDWPGYSPEKSPQPCRAISVGVAGDLTLTLAGGDGSNQTLTLAANVVYPLQARAIVSAGSTATLIQVYW